MSDATLSPDPAPAPEPKASLEALLQAQQTMHLYLNVTLLALLVLSASLFVFFLREASLARRQIVELRKVVMTYEKTTLPVMENFRAKLQAFAATHPDFNAIYLRYFGGSTNPPEAATAAPPSANANPVRMPPGAPK